MTKQRQLEELERQTQQKIEEEKQKREKWNLMLKEEQERKANRMLALKQRKDKQKVWSQTAKNRMKCRAGLFLFGVADASSVSLCAKILFVGQLFIILDPISGSCL